MSAGDSAPSRTGDHLPSSPAPSLDLVPLFLVGPTASGKSALALGVARSIDAQIVSVDSMQVYRGLRTLTAAPDDAQRAAVRHHLVDCVGPDEVFDVARFGREALAVHAALRARGRRTLFVGGTMLYLKALWDGLAALPGRDPALRRALEEEAQRLGSPALHARLAAVDPRAAARLHPHDAKRIVRALEVHAQGGVAMSAWLDAGAASHAAATRPDESTAGLPPIGSFVAIALVLERARLYARIDERTHAMLAGGAIEEVRALRRGAIAPRGTITQVLGFAPIGDHLDGRLSLEDLDTLLASQTRHYARRQINALRKELRAIPFVPTGWEDQDVEAIVMLDRWARGCLDAT